MENKREKRFSIGKVLMVVGLLLILGAGGLLGYNQWLDRQAGAASDAAAITLVE